MMSGFANHSKEFGFYSERRKPLEIVCFELGSDIFTFIHILKHSVGTWAAQLVMHPTLDFGLGQDLRVWRLSRHHHACFYKISSDERRL